MRSILLLLFLLPGYLACAQEGRPDLTFGTGGVARTVLVAPNGASANTTSDITGIAVQPDGRILQAGYKSSALGDDFILIRYTAGGAPDGSFGPGTGWVATDFNSQNDRAHSVAIAADGRIVVAGEATVAGKNIAALARYLPDGTLDNSFGTGGRVRADLGPGTSGAYTVEIQPDGKILIGGFLANGTNNDFLLARFLTDGSADPTFGTGGKTTIDFSGAKDAITSLGLLPDGRIVAGGWAGSPTDVFALAVFSGSGVPDATFNGNGRLATAIAGQGRRVGISPTQKIFITGPSGSDFTTASFNLDGTPNTAWNGTGLVRTAMSSGAEAARSVLVQADGKVVVGGDLSGPSGQSYGVVRYLTNGALDPSFNGVGKTIFNTGGGNRDYGFSGLAFQNGKILMGGISFTSGSFWLRFHPTVIRLTSNVHLVTTNQSVCAPGTVDLTAPAVTAGSDAGLTFTYWRDTMATQPLSNPSAIAMGGTYFIKGTNATGNFAVKPVTVTITPAPAGTISPASVTLCAGGYQILTATGGYSYQWYHDGVLSFGATGATHLAAAAGTYSVILFDGACQAPASNTVTVTFGAPPTGTITPASAVICPGGSQVLTVSGGSSYQWSRNGSPIAGATGPTYTATQAGSYSALIFAGSCSGAAADTAILTMGTTVTPAISITRNPAGPIAPGTAVTFTANITGGGAPPVIQWKVNGANAGANATTFTTSTLVQGDLVTAELTSSAPCATPATVASNALTMTVQSVVPSVTIAASPSGPVCSGTTITFTAAPVNGGPTPVYQWMRNGAPAGTNSATFSTSSLANQDSVWVVMTSNAPGASPATVGSNRIVVAIQPALTPSVSIAASPGTTVCSGTAITYSATAVNGGNAPQLQWRKNGTAVGSGISYTDANPANGDSVWVELTSNAACVQPATAAAGLRIAVQQPPAGTITPAQASICSGGQAQLSVTGGGTYQWQLNGSAIAGATSATHMATAAGTYSVVITNGPCSAPASNTATVSTTPALTPSIAITISPSGPAVPGTLLTFTATVTNGGSSPVIQWKVNGVNVGTNAASFSSATLAQGDVVTATLTSNAACVTTATATSNPITVSATSVTPTVSITMSPAGLVCAGTPVTFTATATNGGAAPVFQWKVNGSNTGSGGTTFSTTTLAHSDSVWVVLTSNAPGASPQTVESNRVVVSVQTALPPSVTISANPGPSVCADTPVTYTASVSNGGNSPVLQWKKNGVSVGNGATSYTDSTPADGDTVSVEITSTAACALPSTAAAGLRLTVRPIPSGTITPATVTICSGTQIVLTATGGGSYQWQQAGTPIAGATGSTYTATTAGTYSVMITNGGCSAPASNTATVSVDAAVAPTIGISMSPSGPVTPGTTLTFTAVISNSGSSPVIQWKVNGLPVGTNSPTFTTSSLQQGDVVTATLASNAACAAPGTATSNAIIISATTVTPTVSITQTPAGATCAGDSLTFTATATNGGTTPIFQWRRNGVAIGGSQALLAGNQFANGDSVWVELTSNAPGAAPQMVTSNRIVISRTPISTPSISISVSPAGPVAPGTQLTFSATVTNGGSSPVIQWKVNGNNVGTNSPSFSSSSLGAGDIVTAVLTSNMPCAAPLAATSNAITVAGPAASTPSVSITVSPSGPVCSGTPLTFTAAPVNGGTPPQYQWFVNGTPASNGGAAFTTATLQNQDTVWVILTSNAPGAVPLTAISNRIVVDITSTQAPVVSVAANPGNTICAGTAVTFTATVTGGGSAPQYQWRKNGLPAGTNSPTYTDGALAQGDSVDVVVVSNAACAQPAQALSAAVHISVGAPSGSITPATGSICAGGSLVLTATAGYSYQWSLNGMPIVGATGQTYAATTPGSYSVVLASGSCSAPAGNTALVTAAQSITPSISISASPATTVAPGMPLTFTAIISGGGTAPQVQWLRNGAAAGTGTSYTAANFTNGETVSATLASNAPCAQPATVSGNTIAVSVLPPVIASVTIAAGNSAPACAGSPISFTATATGGGANPGFQWMVNGAPVSGAGSAFTTTSLRNGDTVSVRMTSSDPAATPQVSVSNPLRVSIIDAGGVLSPATAILCPGSQLTISATGGSGYEWYRDSIRIPNASGTSLTVSAPGSYTAVVIDSGCRGGANASVITAGSPPDGTITPAQGSLCPGDTLHLTAIAPGATGYQWRVNGNPIAGETGAGYVATEAGSYSVVLYNGSCSAMAQNHSVIRAKAVPVGRHNTVPVQRNRPFPLQACDGGTDYRWSPAIDLSSTTTANTTVTTQQDRDYGIRIGQVAGCPVTDSVHVRVYDGAEVFVPSGFTPNNDGRNDLLRPTAVHIREIRYFRVLSRWNEMVFETRTPGEGWNGVYKGVPQPTNTYIWVFEGIDTEGRVVQARGTSTLIR